MAGLYTTTILALERLKWENHGLKVSLGYNSKGPKEGGKYVVVIFPTSAITLMIFKRLNKFEEIRALKPRTFEK